MPAGFPLKELLLSTDNIQCFSRIRFGHIVVFPVNGSLIIEKIFVCACDHDGF
jgi:hypothetical protein